MVGFRFARLPTAIGKRVRLPSSGRHFRETRIMNRKATALAAAFAVGGFTVIGCQGQGGRDTSNDSVQASGVGARGSYGGSGTYGSSGGTYSGSNTGSYGSGGYSGDRM